MASHFKWYPSDEEVVVPWNAQYSFPSQSNKAVKLTPRIPPKTGSTYNPGEIVRLEFPAQGYVNPANTTLEFDVILTPGLNADGSVARGQITRFQNNIFSLFSRARLLYGSTPLEDLINCNVIVRALTEWTSTNQTGTMDQSTICEGIGGVVLGAEYDGVNTETVTQFGLVNVRQFYIQGYSLPLVNFTGDANGYTPSDFSRGNGPGFVPNRLPVGTPMKCTRRYQVQLPFGIFNQDKLVNFI